MARIRITEPFMRTAPLLAATGGVVLVPATGAEVKVCSRGTTTPVTVYAGTSGSSTLPQPLTVDELGNVPGYVNDGRYDLIVTGGGSAGGTRQWEASEGGAVGSGGGVDLGAFGESGVALAADDATITEALGERLPAVESKSGTSQVNRIVFLGQSLIANEGVNANDGMAAKIAAALDAEGMNYAVSGSCLPIEDLSTPPNYPGGFATALAAVKPVDGAGAIRQAAPYLPMADLFVAMWGGNDLYQIHPTVPNTLAAVKLAFEAVIAWCRLGGAFGDTHASCSYSSNWGAGSGAGFETNAGNAFGTNHYTTTAGTTVTIDVPDDFPGGEVDAFFLLIPALGGRPNLTSTVDGAPGPSKDLRPANLVSSGGNKNNLGCLRFPDLAPGGHTIVITNQAFGGGSGASAFIGWGIAAQELPVVVVPNMPRLAAYGTLPGAPKTTINDGDVDSLNVATQEIVDLFDDRVVLADLQGKFADAGVEKVVYTAPNSPHVSDNAHLNSFGNNLCAEAVLDVVPSALGSRRATSPAAPQPRWMARGQLSPLPNGTEPGFSGKWSEYLAGSSPGVNFSKDKHGRVTLRGQVKRSDGTGLTTSEPIFTLPKGYRARQDGQLFTVTLGNLTLGLVELKANGQLQYLSGAAAGVTAFLALDGISFQADGA